MNTTRICTCIKRIMKNSDNARSVQRLPAYLQILSFQSGADRKLQVVSVVVFHDGNSSFFSPKYIEELFNGLSDCDVRGFYNVAVKIVIVTNRKISPQFSSFCFVNQTSFHSLRKEMEFSLTHCSL